MGVMKTNEVRIGTVVIGAILVFVLAAMCYEYGPVEISGYKELTRDAIYMGGATIIALAVFGSVLGTGIITGKGKKFGERDIVFVYGGTIGITVTQGLNMAVACCLNLNAILLTFSTYITIVCTVPIILGFAQIVERQQSGSKGQDNVQSGAHDGKPEDADPKTKLDKGQACAKDGADTELHFRFKSGRGKGDAPPAD